MSAMTLRHSQEKSVSKNGAEMKNEPHEQEGAGGKSGSPEERWKLKQFEEWLKQTAEELRLDDKTQIRRKALYRSVRNLSPYDPIKMHEEVEASIRTWKAEHKKDPLVPQLLDYLQSKIDLAKELRLTFPDYGEEKLPFLVQKQKK